MRPDPSPDELAKMPPNLQHYYKTRHETRERRKEYLKAYYERQMSDPLMLARKRSQSRAATRTWREKNIEVSRERTKKSVGKWRENNYETYLQKARESRIRTTERNKRIQAMFNRSGCAICGEKESGVLDAHHSDESMKSFNIGVKLHSTISIDRLVNEYAKCVCLCATCRRKVHNGTLTCPLPIFNPVAAKIELEQQSNQVSLPADDQSSLHHHAVGSEAPAGTGAQGVVLPSIQDVTP